MSNRLKGFVVLEIPVIICVVMILSCISIKCYSEGEKVYAYRNEIRHDSIIFKAIKGELIYNCDYCKFKSMIDSNDIWYINSDNLDISKIMQGDIINLMDVNINNQGKYIEIQKIYSENIIKLRMELINSRYNFANIKEEIYLSKNIKLSGQKGSL